MLRSAPGGYNLSAWFWAGGSTLVSILIVAIIVLAFFLIRKRRRADPAATTRRRMQLEMLRLLRRGNPFVVFLVEFRTLEGPLKSMDAIKECRRALRMLCAMEFGDKTSGPLRGAGYGAVVSIAVKPEEVARRIVAAFNRPTFVDGKKGIIPAAVSYRKVAPRESGEPWLIFGQANLAMLAAESGS